MMVSPTHQHGGQLQKAAQHYQISPEQWLDLSTGISPVVYPIPDIPQACWQRLPEVKDGLEQVAANYYGSESLLAVAGSQEAIQRLPLLWSAAKIGIVSPAYHSHFNAWQSAGHTVLTIAPDAIDTHLSQIDILLIVNPTNPTTCFYSKEQLLQWHLVLQKSGGCLIVDEAFMDCTPEGSLIESEPKQGLIVLRSLGKFFGLAGIRLGFVWAQAPILHALVQYQDDWSVSHPARFVGKTALQDLVWQQQQRVYLEQAGRRLQRLLQEVYQIPVYATALFAYIELPHAPQEYERLAQQGILVRLFKEKPALRFGLPHLEAEWTRLEQALYKKA